MRMNKKEQIEKIVSLLNKAFDENCKTCTYCKYETYPDCNTRIYAEAIYEELQRKQFGNKSGFRKGYQKGFADGVKFGKSFCEPKLPEVNEKGEPEQLNDLVYRPLTQSPCLNCDFYKKYLAGGQLFIGDAPCQWCENQPGKITCATTTTTTGTKIDKGDK